MKFLEGEVNLSHSTRLWKAIKICKTLILTLKINILGKKNIYFFKYIFYNNVQIIRHVHSVYFLFFFYIKSIQPKEMAWKWKYQVKKFQKINQAFEMSLSEPFVLFFIYILIAIILMILMSKLKDWKTSLHELNFTIRIYLVCWAAKPTKQIQVSNTSRQSRFDSRVSSSKRDSLNAIHVPLKGSLNLS